MIRVITGQTATGKTSYALKLAQKINGELISADARQLYKTLDIVTGKDLHHTTGPFQLKKSINSKGIGYYPVGDNTRLWLYDVINPDQTFSTYDYRQCANYVIDDIVSRGKTPIIIGGSYFYIKHLLYDVVDNAIPPNNNLRSKLDRYSIKQLQDMLKQLNAYLFDSLNNSEQNNPQRLIRKIEKEVYHVKHPPQSPLKGGSSLLDLPFEGSPRRERDVTCSITGFRFNNKDDLQKAITNRVENRLKAGAIEETQKIVKSGYNSHDPGLKTIGYTQIMQYINNDISKEEMKKIWITKEVQYAKRQLTFMKKNTIITWIYH